MGVVNHSVPQNAEGDAAFQRALSLAEEIIPNGPVGVRMAKIAVNRGSDVDINTGLAIEENCYAQVRATWLPDGYSQIFRSHVFGPSGFWTMAPLRYAAKFDPFLSLDCARVEGVGCNPRKFCSVV